MMQNVYYDFVLRGWIVVDDEMRGMMRMMMLATIGPKMISPKLHTRQNTKQEQQTLERKFKNVIFMYQGYCCRS